MYLILMNDRNNEKNISWCNQLRWISTLKGRTFIESTLISTRIWQILSQETEKNLVHHLTGSMPISLNLGPIVFLYEIMCIYLCVHVGVSFCYISDHSVPFIKNIAATYSPFIHSMKTPTIDSFIWNERMHFHRQ